MTKNMNSLFKMSVFIRNLTLISNRSSPVRLFRTVTAYNRSQEQQNETKHPPSTKYFAPATKTFKMIPSKLNNCKDYTDVFDVIREHHHQMNGSEAARALQVMFDAAKDNNTFDLKAITQKREFSLLCNTLKNRMSHLNDHEVIESLKVLTFLNIPTTSVIVQMLLQMIRHSMNNLSIQQIIFVSFLLSKCRKGPLVDALSIALPIVLNANIKTLLANEDTSTILQVLRYISLKESSQNDETVSTLLKAIVHCDKSKMTARDALSALLFLFKHPLNEELKKFLLEVQKTLIDSADELQVSEILKIGHEINNKCLSKDKHFYHEGLVDALAMTIMTRDLGFDAALQYSSVLCKMTHTNTSLLDYIAAKAFENPEIIEKTDGNAKNAVSILASMSNADYKPVFWDTLKESLLTPSLLGLSQNLRIKTAIYLASLDCFWPELLAKIFTESNRSLSVTLKKKLRLVYHATKTMYPEYNGPWPSDETLQMINTDLNVHESDDSFKKALESALGGPQYILSNLISDTSYYLDHIVVLRKGGYPVAINAQNENESFKKLSDIKICEDSQVIMFLLIPKFGCSINTQRLTGFWSLLQKIIKIQTNYTIIPISSSMWHEFNEAEQCRYISQAIRLKCDEISANASP